MAISFKNVITRMYSGRVGDIVFRNYGGKSVMSKRPDCSKVVRSETQLKNQAKFAKDVKISKAVKNDPQLAKFYSEKKKKMKYKDVYHAAMSDCMTIPKVQKVNLKTYRGLQGNVIRISALDKFRVETVSVMIMNKTGQLIESGPAVARIYSGNREWDYTTTAENVDYKSCRVLVRVTDRRGNVVQQDLDIDGSS
jgi:DUF917 family protein